MLNSYADEFEVNGKTYSYFPVGKIAGANALPFSLKVLLENVLRNAPTDAQATVLAERIVEAGTNAQVGEEVEFCPARVLFQDFTGVPVFVDFAVMREAFAALGGDPMRINPQVQCDLVIDHSVIADEAGCADCMDKNMKLEFERNRERYEFLRWAQDSFENVRIVPPGQGICHQLNIEQFASVVMTKDLNAEVSSPGIASKLAYFDTLVGTDSHTPTANGIGVLGWGVGGIEAEAAALGQPITTLVPKVIGVKLTGELSSGVAAMDVALTFAEKLRQQEVVGCFVECFGPGVAALSATQRACISNMTPEYGSTCTLFPVDEKTLDFLKMTGRSDDQINLVREYSKLQGFWNDEACQGDDSLGTHYSAVIEIDLSQVKPSIAGPSRPHDRIERASAGARFAKICTERNLDMRKRASVEIGGQTYELGHGALAIAAVTSCTTATDQEMMLAAGLIARNAAARGLKPKPWVKTILAPGSHATEILMQRTGLAEGLQELGFYTCGFGCMSCIGNSGPLMQQMHDVADDIELASALSGNRNFEGRISPDVSQNYLMTPANVIAYALAGTMDVDIERDSLGKDAQGADVFLSDILPDEAELQALLDQYVNDDLYKCGSVGLYEGSPEWQAISAPAADDFAWDEQSTYVRRPTFFDGMGAQAPGAEPIENARVLALLGDFITTDHISPAGAIAPDSPAARYLETHGVAPEDFNTYGARRGNHEAMMRGTFANVKLKNQLGDGKTGSWTRDMLSGQMNTIFDVAQHYAEAGVPCIVLAGKMYGSGSSRDWAAKGPALLGVRAVIAESFERIHRSNLIGMGILPLQFLSGENAESLGLTGNEVFSIGALDFSKGTPEPEQVEVTAVREDGSALKFYAQVRIDTPTEGSYYENGGILQYVLRDMK